MPSNTWRKKDVVKSLFVKNTQFRGNSLKRGLLREVDTVRNEYTSCVVDETEEQRGVSMRNHLQTSASKA